MKKIKPTSNEKLAIIKSKKPQIKTLKRIQTNKCERILPKMCSQQENRFFFENKHEEMKFAWLMFPLEVLRKRQI